MNIQYVSDLHLEIFDNAVFIARNPFKIAGDILVIAGDTIPLREIDSYKKHTFFDWCSANFKETLLVPGNHEYYRDNIDRYPESWVEDIRQNVHIYQNSCIRIGDTDFILSTLWTHIPGKEWLALKRNMQDFRLIRTDAGSFTATDYNALHARDLAYIKEAVAHSNAKRKVVITHHVPSKLCVAPEFTRSNIGSGFSVDLTDYIERSNIDVWVYGHSHRSVETVIGKTRLVSNQVGYVLYREYKGNFVNDKYVEL